MATHTRSPPMHIKLSEERRALLVSELQAYYQDEYDRSLSEFQAQGLIDFLVGLLGPPIYNQAIQDVRASLQGKLDDLEGEFYEPEP